ncbi:hypothetical protein L914_04513 [Phytophthora nicotianae]|uniref:Uncharacterized protein n=1 Tax=Phytophthora nicotianae TaxID=4792 RepID=W2NSR6_PHYNI|nr:hypothetical protein L914_04513 [Phytophthora nicotianae]
MDNAMDNAQSQDSYLRKNGTKIERKNLHVGEHVSNGKPLRSTMITGLRVLVASEVAFQKLPQNRPL